MITSYVVLFAATCYVLKTLPGVVQAMGYLFGLVLAIWSVEEFFSRN